MHSEYTFGNCQEGNIKFFVHVHKDHMDVLGKLIIRVNFFIYIKFIVKFNYINLHISTGVAEYTENTNMYSIESYLLRD